MKLKAEMVKENFLEFFREHRKINIDNKSKRTSVCFVTNKFDLKDLEVWIKEELNITDEDIVAYNKSKNLFIGRYPLISYLSREYNFMLSFIRLVNPQPSNKELLLLRMGKLIRPPSMINDLLYIDKDILDLEAETLSELTKKHYLIN